jgi:hypothetical protein
MDRLTQNPSSFSTSFPTSWAIGANGLSNPPPPPPLPRQNLPLPINASSQETTIASYPPVTAPEYFTHFPSSWVVSSTKPPPQSRLALEHDPKYLANTLRDSVGRTSSTFSSTLTLRPRMGEVQERSGPHLLLAQGEDLKQRLLAHISPPGIEQTSTPERERKTASSAIQALVQPQQNGQLLQLPENTHNWRNIRRESIGTPLFREDDHDSDGSGLGDAPHQSLELADTYSVYTNSSAVTNLK